MPRRLRGSDAGYAYHVLNRAVGRATLFHKAADYAAFEKILRQGWEGFGIGVLSFVLMPNHWHMVVKPQQDGALSTYLQTAQVLGLESTLRARGRPRKPPQEKET
jgi:putative transposase